MLKDMLIKAGEAARFPTAANLRKYRVARNIRLQFVGDRENVLEELFRNNCAPMTKDLYGLKDDAFAKAVLRAAHLSDLDHDLHRGVICDFDDTPERAAMREVDRCLNQVGIWYEASVVEENLLLWNEVMRGTTTIRRRLAALMRVL